jgi:hypothetical protein
MIIVIAALLFVFLGGLVLLIGLLVGFVQWLRFSRSLPGPVWNVRIIHDTQDEDEDPE